MGTEKYHLEGRRMTQIESARSATTRVSWNRAIVTFLFLIGLLSACHAQLVTTGTINGTVVDQSGAAVPGASVVITDVGTNTVTRTVSNSDGSFSQVGLQSGNYEVTTASPGFASFKEKGIYLEPTGTYSIHVTLKPGSVTSTVTVTAAPAQVQISTSEISNTVSGEEAQALPLNGRNYEQLGSLMPGVRNTSPVAPMGTGGYTTTNTLSVNGGSLSGLGGQGPSPSGSIYYLDGIWNSASVEHDEPVVLPNPDEIAEVKVMQNNYSAQYTLLGASVVLVETKSGTNSFHGGAWEFLRNTALDATPYFAAKPSVLHWNIFGWNLGGPLFVPRVYNTNKKKTFFYFNQQWVRQTQGQVVRGVSPTADMRAGTFPIAGSDSPFLTKTNGGWLRDPTKTGVCNATVHTACFPNNQIPPDRIDPNALAILNALAPLPNNPSGGFDNYLNTNSNITDQMDVMAKVDHNISSNLRLTGEYFVEEQTFTGANAARMGSPFSTNYDVFSTDDQAGQLRLTQILSPSMTNQTSIATSIFDVTHDFGGIRLLSQLSNFNQVLPYTGGFLQTYVPHITYTGGWSQFGSGASWIIPRATDLHDTITDDWSWLHGKHFLQAGFTMLFGTERHWSTTGQTMGQFHFSGYDTGNAMADYLLGDAATFQQTNNGIRTYAHYPIATPYVEDQWKATQRLTITAGVRGYYMPWPTEQTGYIVAFDPAAFDPAKAPIVSTKGIITPTPTYSQTNGIIQNGINGVPQNLTDAHKYYVAPVVGFAMDVFGDGRTSLRGGYGVTYNESAGQGCDEGGCLGYPVLKQVNLIDANFSNPAGATAAAISAPGVSGEDLQNYKASFIQTYSLSWQQQFGVNWLVSVAGAGSIVRNGIQEPNINQPKPVPGYDFDPRLNTGTYANSYFAPYLGYAGIGFYQNTGKSYWNALEFLLQHRAGHNLYLTAAYTWSHALDNYGGFQNNYNLQAAYGNSGQNIPHVFTASLIYSLPQLQSSRVWKRIVLGGWKYSDMTTIQSGGSGTFGLSTSHNGLASRPNLIAPLTYPKKYNQWFSTGSFAQPAPGFFGNVGNGTFMGPGLIDFNMAGYKEFPVTHGANLEFRAEFFNIFNHRNPNGPNTSFGNGNFGVITSAKDPREGEVALKLIF